MSISVQKLGELVTVKGGGTPSKKVDEYWNGDIPWASVKDLKTRVLSKAEDYITMQGVENSATNIIPQGTIIVPTRMALGKVAIAGVDLAINQDLKALFIKDENVLDKQYLARFLESKAKYIEGEGKGATVKGITLDFLKSIEIPLPPLAEQKRIAAILDKADAIRQKRKQAIDLADEFLRSVFLDMFGDPKINPKNWEKCKFLDLIDFVTYGLTVRPEYIESGLSLISAREIKTGEVYLKSAPKISLQDFDNLSDKAKPKIDDILFSKTGSIGHCALVTDSEEFAVTQNVARIVPDKSKVHPIFLLSLLRTKYFYDLSNREAKGNAVKDLQLGVMKEFDVYCPPLEKQVEYVKVRESIVRMVEKQNGAHVGSKDAFYSLSAKAFSDEL